jgi:ABC-type branched-subunit amino acid transport system substrate-binding protein
MRRRIRKFVPLLALLLAFAMIAAACGDGDGDATDTTAAGDGGATDTTAAGDGGATETTAATETTEPMATGPVVVCELAYYTGEFAAYGAFLTAGVQFPLDEVINADPPLGRTWELVSVDIGTVGEGQAARDCIEQQGAEIMVSPAHEYRTYRDWALEWIAENDSPLLPTVHGGTIPGNVGGVGSEPIFRAQGLDEALGMTGALYADHIGAANLVIFATQVEGFQLAAGAAELAAAELGIEVLARIDVPAEQPSYRAEAERIAGFEPDVVIVQAGSIESANLINGAAEAGASLVWVGESGWEIPEFIAALGTDVIPTQQSIGFAGLAPNIDDAAWDYFGPLWDSVAGYGDTHGGGDIAYHFSAYDLLVQTALAVEYGGSYHASDWAPAMFAVGDPPGTVCYTYADCLAEIRAGNDIDYEGVTGPGTYSGGGVNAVTFGLLQYGADGTLGAPEVMDPDVAFEVISKIAVTAECDSANPAGTDPPAPGCTW